ncbi:hypothetical protein H920_06449 [Fukomys damarensis]|uniref:Uncharacterized protein n=1 Tax=Fukomys damarensis TaxID=885580 RepID=A0A091DNQ6_FUKDA|nr:hypothetical protein H920_06449 [Fukomys damarensis]
MGTGTIVWEAPTEEAEEMEEMRRLLSPSFQCRLVSLLTDSLNFQRGLAPNSTVDPCSLEVEVGKTLEFKLPVLT